jgi:hypothetical protein
MHGRHFFVIEALRAATPAESPSQSENSARIDAVRRLRGIACRCNVPAAELSGTISAVESNWFSKNAMQLDERLRALEPLGLTPRELPRRPG